MYDILIFPWDSPPRRASGETSEVVSTDISTLELMIIF